MIKVFTVNKEGKISLTANELQKLLDEAYWEGYGVNKTYTYTTPHPWHSPYNTVTCDSGSATTHTISSNNILTGSTTVSTPM